jgi:Zn-dependent protease with chaperone function
VIFLLIAVALGLLYLPILFYPFGRRLPPQDWSHMTTRSIVMGASALLVSLLLLAAPPLLRASGAGELAQLCDEFLGHVPHSGPVTGLFAAIAFAISISCAALSRIRTARTLADLTVERFIGTHIPTSGFDLVILPAPQPLAYSRQGNPPQVVVTSGLVDSLSDDEFSILLKHEATHLRCGHETDVRTLTMVSWALKWLPGVSRSVSIARLAMERHADEEAAGAQPASRRALARALLASATWMTPDAAPAFNNVQGLSERLEAMTAAAPPLSSRQRVCMTLLAGLMRFSVGAGGALGLMLMGGVCFG